MSVNGGVSLFVDTDQYVTVDKLEQWLLMSVDKVKSQAKCSFDSGLTDQKKMLHTSYFFCGTSSW